jgi:hypothetical protein
VQVVHSSGEMTNPLPLEDLLASALSPLARNVVVGGQQRPYPVVFIEPNHGGGGGDGYSGGGGAEVEALRLALGPALKLANQSAPAYSRLRRDRVVSASAHLDSHVGDLEVKHFGRSVKKQPGGRATSPCVTGASSAPLPCPLGQVLVVEGGPMPTSAKGNVIRKQLEQRYAAAVRFFFLPLARKTAF